MSEDANRDGALAGTCIRMASGMAWTFNDTNAYWAFLVDVTALGPLVRSLPGEAREHFRKTLNERLAAFTGPDSVVLPSQCWGGIAFR